jgi:hypothetical protein
MTAYDRYRVQFDISYWREIWEEDLWDLYQDAIKQEKEKDSANGEFAKKETKPKVQHKTKKATTTVKKTAVKKTKSTTAKKEQAKPTTVKKEETK